MTEKEKLIKELKDKIGANGTEFVHCMVEDVANFIEADLRRICASLLRSKNDHKEPYVWNAIDETLKLAGLDKE